MSTLERQAMAEVQPSTSVITPMDMLRIAVDKGADLDKLQQLMGLQERWEANEARKAYMVAMNAFKANPPDVYKSKQVAFGETSYKHALLSDAVERIGDAMSKQGLSFRWDCEQVEGGIVRVTCIITHAMGHSEKVTLSAGLDQSGKKNSIQALGSTVTYLQRYTLFAATGLAAKDGDDDGGGSEGDYITQEQELSLIALLEETGSDKAKFTSYFGVDSISELPAASYAKAVKAVEAKRKK